MEKLALHFTENERQRAHEIQLLNIKQTCPPPPFDLATNIMLVQPFMGSDPDCYLIFFFLNCHAFEVAPQTMELAASTIQVHW